MTAQVANIIWIDGEERLLLASPMGGFFERFGQPEFYRGNTANRSGYVAEWELEGNRLYLTGLRGRILTDHFRPDGRRVFREITLADLLGERAKPLFADWVSEPLRVACGEITRYVHAGWASQYEHEEMLVFEEGFLVGRRTIKPRLSLRSLSARIAALGRSLNSRFLRYKRDEKSALALNELENGSEPLTGPSASDLEFLTQLARAGFAAQAGEPVHGRVDSSDAPVAGDYWYKVVGMLQQDWAFIDVSDRLRTRIIFVGDDGVVFDDVPSGHRWHAEALLRRNGFERWADDGDAQRVICPPKGRPSFEACRSRPIYSSGECWTS